MTPQEMKAELRVLAGRVEGRLGSVFGDRLAPGPLVASMQYSLLAGGKRLRPVLFLAWADLAGGEVGEVLDFACAIECIHTYSLIHDDLPAMDNDDLRRGKPSNHKQFDEATAILAGDGLLTEAFTLASSLAMPPDRVLQAIRHLSTAAGPRGMVGGQVLDMGLTGKVASLPQLREMHAQKTGALIESSCVTGAILGEGAPRCRSGLRNTVGPSDWLSRSRTIFWTWSGTRRPWASRWAATKPRANPPTPRFWASRRAGLWPGRAWSRRWTPWGDSPTLALGF